MNSHWVSLEELRMDDILTRAKALPNEAEWPPFIIPKLADTPHNPILESIGSKSRTKSKNDALLQKSIVEADEPGILGKVPDLALLQPPEDGHDVWFELIGNHVEYKVRSLLLPQADTSDLASRIISCHGIHLRTRNNATIQRTPHS